MPATRKHEPMVAVKNPYVSPEEYLEREREAETRSEYVNGQILAMAGATREHSLIVLNAGSSLKAQLASRRCEVYVNDMRVKVTNAGVYTYPDVVVACGEVRLEDGRRDTLLNPTVIIEILSPSTEAYDRGAKFFYYRQLDSLSDYLLVAQDAMRIERYSRQSNGLWMLSDASGPEGVIELPSIECSLRLSDVYERIDFGSPGAGG
jgi:Uma2 family endonuclease